MRFVYQILLVNLIFIQFISAQEVIPFGMPKSSIFKKHQQNTLFLNLKQTEIDTIYKLYQALDKTTYDTNLNIYCNALQKSVLEFTNFNSKRLIEIDKELTGNKPIRGSEIAYLHHSFKIYKKYQSTYEVIANDIAQLLKIKKDTKISKILINIQLGQTSLFYKNYYNAIRNKRIRRILNASDATYGIKDNELKRIVYKELSKKKYRSIQREIKYTFYDKNELKCADSALFKQLKNSTYTKSRIRKDKRKMRNYFRRDNAYQVGKFFTHHLSGIIGNAAGAIRMRKGYLYKSNSFIKRLKEQLKPMDILAEKTGFALTDKMIPGYFGHIALWLGTEEQLKRLNLWNTPSIKPFQVRIKNGYSVLESARNGTHLKTLANFINVDELAVSRIKAFNGFSQKEKETLYQNALAQLGKKYDFNFDVETSDKLVCSELLYQVFGSIYWPTDKFLKRSTISPDNVLSLALYLNSPISLIYYVKAKDKHSFHLKTIEDLAKDLGYEKHNDNYVLPDKKCRKNIDSKEKQNKKKCEKIYHKLIYTE